MNIPATVASLLIAAGAAFIPASAATAAPLAGPLALGEAVSAPIVQAQVRQPRRALRAYAAPYGGFLRRCVSGDDSTTSAYPSWAVCRPE